MRAPSLAAIVVVLIGASLFVLIAISGRGHQPPPAPAAAVAPASGISNGDVTLTSTAVDLPDDMATFPPGQHADLVNQRCLACHSAGMVLTQPKLKPEQWTAIVEKMRDAYRAPIAEGEVPAITAYLVAQQSPTASQAPAAPR